MTECPVCAAKEAAGDTQPGMARVVQPVQTPAGPVPAPMPVAPPLPPRQQTYTVPQPKSGLPPWLVAAGVAILMGLVLALGYLVLLPKLRNGSRSTTAAPPITMESPSQAAPVSATPAASAGSKFGKYIEVVGLRIIEENKKASVKFLIVNHAGAELTDVNGTVEIHPTNAQTMVGRVEVKIPSLAPYESREFSASLNTTLRAYEIPDWQFLRGKFVE